MSQLSEEDLIKVHRAVIADMMRVVLRLKNASGIRSSDILYIMSNVWRGGGDLQFENFLLLKSHEYRRYERSGR